ncbi:hypothetical protein HYD56_00850 [Mycoplasmopsis bovis]|nr:hypothetical protein [Mycoplasmopsis bovis]QQH66515.1 hypothetical protein HYD56_00850 [Mycoplasmopsis bovis]
MLSTKDIKEYDPYKQLLSDLKQAISLNFRCVKYLTWNAKQALNKNKIDIKLRQIK